MRAEIDALMEEWNADIRPNIAGEFLQLTGNKAGSATEIVFIALAQDEATYRALADLPEQDVWFQRLSALVVGPISWEDVEMTPS